MLHFVFEFFLKYLTTFIKDCTSTVLLDCARTSWGGMLPIRNDETVYKRRWLLSYNV